MATQPQSNRCPQCGKSFAATVRLCPDDGTVLEQVSPTAAQIGRILDGKYRLDAFLSHGGMGSVFKATHVMLGRAVAVKLINPEIVTSPEIVRRFQREARAATALSHPNITGVYDLGQTSDGTLYIAMEFIDGPTLKSVLKSGPMPAARIVAILRQVAAALSAAHRHGIVHRDLKPHNIMLVRDENGRDVAKLVDFGIAKTFDESTQLTQTGFALGTPQYMAPEQAEGRPVDGRSDIYSLGVILYEMLAGDVPFNDQSTPAILIKHIKEMPPLPSLRNPGAQVSPDLEAIAMKCLEKDPANRFQSADEFAAALEAADPGAAGTAAGTSAAQAATLPMGTRTAAPQPAWDFATAAAPAADALAPTLVGGATAAAAPTLPIPRARAGEATSAAPLPTVASPNPGPAGPGAASAPPAGATLPTVPTARPSTPVSSAAPERVAAVPASAGPVAASAPASKLPLVLVLGGLVIAAAGTGWFVYGRAPLADAPPTAPATIGAITQPAAQPRSEAPASPPAPNAAAPPAQSGSPAATPTGNSSAPSQPPAPPASPLRESTGVTASRSDRSPADKSGSRSAASAPGAAPAAQPVAPDAMPAPNGGTANRAAPEPPASPAPVPANPGVAFRCTGPGEVCAAIRNAVDEALQKAGFVSLRNAARADVSVEATVTPVDERVTQQFGTTFAVRNYSIDVSGEAPKTGEGVPMPGATTLSYDPKFGSERVNEKARLIADGIAEKVKAYVARRR